MYTKQPTLNQKILIAQTYCIPGNSGNTNEQNDYGLSLLSLLLNKLDNTFCF